MVRCPVCAGAVQTGWWDHGALRAWLGEWSRGAVWAQQPVVLWCACGWIEAARGEQVLQAAVEEVPVEAGEGATAWEDRWRETQVRRKARGENHSWRPN